MQNHTATELTCPACGFPESRLRHSLQLGCPVCYETFAPHLATFLPKLHTGTLHKGKTPNPGILPVKDIIRRIHALADRIATEAPDSLAHLVTDMLRHQIQTETQIPTHPDHPDHPDRKSP